MGRGFQRIGQGQETAVLFAGRVFPEDIPQGIQAAAPGTVQVMIDILRIIELAYILKLISWRLAFLRRHLIQKRLVPKLLVRIDQ